MKKSIVISSLLILPQFVFATDLLPLPGNWLDQIATSSAPLFTALGPFIWFLVGIAFVGMVFRWLTNR